ncbi:hypothetical protein KSP40_PGU002065 [Platanthera guangdongensis]|uniref:Coenzyme Q-binding protein COQ10 START domain-containing protein n=1 Tax=Platanthera guangdongensis TaxID=2320717 RepID=A0ABR2M2E9_9ASPA
MSEEEVRGEPEYLFSLFRSFLWKNPFSLPQEPPIFSKSSPGPVDFNPLSSLHLEDTKIIGEEVEKRWDFYLEAMSWDEDFEIEVFKVEGKNNRRRIRSCVRVDADLSSVWRVLTNYDGLSTFIPSLAVSQLLEKRQNFARIYQVGEQNLALGLKFERQRILRVLSEGDLEDLLPCSEEGDLRQHLVING